jgi:serine/threonine protein phosphatase 1
MALARTLAIGDIHGTLSALDALLRVVNPTPEDTVVFLGDYVNRGLDSAGVLDRLLELGGRCRTVTLLGNHDRMMVKACSTKSREWREAWLAMGGQATLDSYPDAEFSSVPERHLRFLRSCRLWYEDGARIYVHGGVEPHLLVSEQREDVLLSRRVYDARPHCSGKRVICGHTVQACGFPLHLGHTICLDTGAVYEGWLTCMNVDTGWCWQSTEAGELREIMAHAPDDQKPNLA